MFCSFFFLPQRLSFSWLAPFSHFALLHQNDSKMYAVIKNFQRKLDNLQNFKLHVNHTIINCDWVYSVSPRLLMFSTLKKIFL